VAKHRFNQKEQQTVERQGQPTAQETCQRRLQGLLQQRKYRQALAEIKKLRHSTPEMELTPKEAEIWWLRGQQEFQQSDFKQAESSFRRALDLGLNGEVHYWLAKCLLALNRLDTALDLLGTAFEQKVLPKDYSVCYLKLLLLKGDLAAVEQLLTQQEKRFSAAQLNWARGVLALKSGQFETALSSLEKIQHPVTPGEIPAAWLAYTQQALGNWDAAAASLGLGADTLGRLSSRPPILKRLALFQQAKTGKSLQEIADRNSWDQADQEVVLVLEVFHLLDQGNFHDAGHVLLKLGPSRTRFPELATLRPALLTLAGEQALTQGQPECAETFWQPLVAEPPFNAQLAVNLLAVLEANGSEPERQRLVTRLLKWLEQQAKQHPQDWPETRRKPTLAHLHCRLADAWMAQGRYRAALGSLQQAERIFPQSPEVLGRRGLLAAMEENSQEATVLLTQALEGGCRYEEVYRVLLKCWQELGDKPAYNETRRRFGKDFGELNVEAEVEVLPWIEALSTQNYSFFSHLVQTEDQPDPALRACRIFVDAVSGAPTASGRVSFQQAAALKQWEALLRGLSAVEQIPVLQAIALSLQLFAKREKGIAGLISQYVQQLKLLSAQHPAAKAAHLVVLAVKETPPQKLQVPLQSYLETTPQPGTTLAQIQLQVRRFTQTKVLTSFIDAARRQEPQHPMLLLAKATTFPVNSPDYEEFRQQGFELARRLQDGKALQAFRSEQAFRDAWEAQQLLPEPEDFAHLDQADADDFVENLSRKIFGQQISRAELERMLPELKQRMLESLAAFELDAEPDFDLPISPPKSKKRKRGFQDL